MPAIDKIKAASNRSHALHAMRKLIDPKLDGRNPDKETIQLAAELAAEEWQIPIKEIPDLIAFWEADRNFACARGIF